MESRPRKTEISDGTSVASLNGRRRGNESRKALERFSQGTKKYSIGR